MRGAPKRRLTEEQIYFMKRLNGGVDPMPVLLGSDRRARYALMRLIFNRLRELMRSNPDLEFLFVTIINDQWNTSDERTQIPLRRSQAQMRRIMRLISPDWWGTVELQVFSNVRHRRGGKCLSDHGHLIAWGNSIHANAIAVAQACNKRITTSTEGCDAVVIERIGPTLLDLGRVVRYMFKSPDRCKNVYINRAKGIATINENEAGDRYVRYFRLFQILSLVQLDWLIFGGGLGARIRADALRQAHDEREALTGRRKRADVLAEVTAFWVDLIPKLGHQRFRRPRFR